MPTGPIETSLLFAYLLLGPIAWGLYHFMMFLGRKRMRLLVRPPVEVPGEKPLVSLLIPAKDEGERIRRCLQSALAQDYPNLQVISIDDRSVDQTGKIMDELAAENPRLKVLHLTELPPPGWTGKNRALHEGVKQATGDWLLMVDSDVLLEPDVLSCAMAVVRRKNFGMLSLLPKLEAETFWEGLLIPLCGGAASSLYMIALNNVGEYKGAAFANGQFMLMNRKAYEQIGGHESVKDRFCEDIAIAQRFKAANLRPRVAWGTDYCSVRMYNGKDAVIRGWSRIYYAAHNGTPWRVLIGSIWLLLCTFPVVPAMAWGIYRIFHPVPAVFGSVTLSWLLMSVIHLGIMTSAIATLYHWSFNPRRYAALFLPIGAPMLLRIFGRALKMCITKKVEWRGTSYQKNQGANVAVG